MPPTQPRAKRLLTIVTVAAWLYAMSVAIGKAYDIRLHAIKTYGYVIHEFDPWFQLSGHGIFGREWTKQVLHVVRPHGLVPSR